MQRKKLLNPASAAIFPQIWLSSPRIETSDLEVLFFRATENPSSGVRNPFVPPVAIFLSIREDTSSWKVGHVERSQELPRLCRLENLLGSANGKFWSLFFLFKSNSLVSPFYFSADSDVFEIESEVGPRADINSRLFKQDLNLRDFCSRQIGWCAFNSNKTSSTRILSLWSHHHMRLLSRRGETSWDLIVYRHPSGLGHQNDSGKSVAKGLLG